jgi:Fe2+ transport system protein FeoA
MPPEAFSRRVLLSTLKTGAEARVSSVEGDESVRHRIEEMGIREGVTIRMIRSQAPQIIAIHGRRLCLRMNAHLQIWVEATESVGLTGGSVCPT